MSLTEFAPSFLALEHRDDVVVVRVTVPTLTEDINLEQLGHELYALIEQYGCRKIIVNLCDVRYLTSAGLGKMITLHRKAHRQQSHVVFCAVQETVFDVLQAAKLHTYFRLCPDVTEGIRMLVGV